MTGLLNIYVCVGSACHLKGAYNIINELQHIIEERQLGEKIVVKAALCLGKCTTAVSVRVDGEDEVLSLSAGGAGRFFDNVVMEKLRRMD